MYTMLFRTKKKSSDSWLWPPSLRSMYCVTELRFPLQLLQQMRRLLNVRPNNRVELQQRRFLCYIWAFINLYTLTDMHLQHSSVSKHQGCKTAVHCTWGLPLILLCSSASDVHTSCCITRELQVKWTILLTRRVVSIYLLVYLATFVSDGQNQQFLSSCQCLCKMLEDLWISHRR